MRVLWLNHFLPFPPKGGALQRSHHLLRQVASRHEVHLVALNQPTLIRQTGSSTEEAARVLRSFCSAVDWFEIPAESSRARRLTTIALAGPRRKPYDVYWLRSGAFSRHLRRLFADESFDLLHVDTLGLAPYARMASNIPMVLNHHNVESQMMHRRADAETNPLRRLYFSREARKLARFERSVCPTFDANVVVSELDAERLRSGVGDVPTYVVENGTDTEFFVPRKPVGHGAGNIIFAGRLNWYPNRNAIRLLLAEIWPALVADRPERRLTIVGSNPPPELVAAAVADSRITVTGFVDDVRPFLDAAAIYICPILDGGGTRLKIVDALAMAKPLVATAMAVEGLGLIENEHYVRAETASDFVAQIGLLESDALLRERLARSGRAFIEERYSWRSIGAHLENAYDAARATASSPANE